MQPRSERQKILWAVFVSLLLHLLVGVSIASFGDKLQPSLPEEEKPVELTIMDLAPMPTPPAVPKNTPFIDTAEQTATKEEPKEKTFESNTNSIAASELPALGIAPIPTQEGKELPTMDLTNRQHSLEREGAQPQPSSRPSSPPVPSATPRPTPQPTAAQSPTATPAYAATDGRSIAHRYSCFYAPADADADADAECRFTGNVSRQPAAYCSYARARERDQASFPKGIAGTSATPPGIVSVST